jgi:hypothetical protein
VASYLAASGEGGGGGLIISIGEISLAGEKHLSVAVNASIAAGWGLRGGGRRDVIAFSAVR